jgi:chromosome partitioning protein
MPIIAVANQKGGVGKTTTVVNLGAALAEQGHKVLAVDFDPQGSLTLALGVNPDDLETTIYDVLAAEIADRSNPSITDVITSTRAGIDLAPANIELSAAELDLVNALSREKLLAEILEPIKKDYDYILVDCPPSLSLLTINALTAAAKVIMPLQADYLAMKGIRLLLRTITRVQAKLNPSLEVAGVLLTMADMRTLHTREVIEATRKALADRVHVFDTVIRMSVRLKESAALGESILTYYKGQTSGAEEYRQLAKEVTNSG